MLWCYFYFQLALLWQRFTKMKIVLSLNFKTDLSQATIVLQWTLHLKWSVQHCAWMFLANIFIIMIVRNVWFGQGEGINSAVIIMWTMKNANRKMSLTLQVLRQLIGPNQGWRSRGPASVSRLASRPNLDGLGLGLGLGRPCLGLGLGGPGLDYNPDIYCHQWSNWIFVVTHQ